MPGVGAAQVMVSHSAFLILAIELTVFSTRRSAIGIWALRTRFRTQREPTLTDKCQLAECLHADCSCTLNPRQVYNHPFVRRTVRVLLLSDIHSNLEALEACLAAAPAYDLVVNLGDVVGYGASPNEVIAISRKLGSVFVRGNHDKAVCGITDVKDFNPIAGLAALWTREQLNDENLEWLRSLPQGPIGVEGILNAQFV